MNMMVYVVVYKKNEIIYQGLQLDDGASAYEYAKEKGAEVRLWEMYGKEHLCEADSNTREEIKNFVKGFRN